MTFVHAIRRKIFLSYRIMTILKFQLVQALHNPSNTSGSVSYQMILNSNWNDASADRSTHVIQAGHSIIAIMEEEDLGENTNLKKHNPNAQLGAVAQHITTHGYLPDKRPGLPNNHIVQMIHTVMDVTAATEDLIVAYVPGKEGNAMSNRGELRVYKHMKDDHTPMSSTIPAAVFSVIASEESELLPVSKDPPHPLDGQSRTGTPGPSILGGTSGKMPHVTKTPDHVQIGSMTRCIYVGTRGGKYVRLQGKLVPLKTALKQSTGKK